MLGCSGTTRGEDVAVFQDEAPNSGQFACFFKHSIYPFCLCMAPCSQPPRFRLLGRLQRQCPGRVCLLLPFVGLSDGDTQEKTRQTALLFVNGVGSLKQGRIRACEETLQKCIPFDSRPHRLEKGYEPKKYPFWVSFKYSLLAQGQEVISKNNVPLPNCYFSLRAKKPPLQEGGTPFPRNTSFHDTSRAAAPGRHPGKPSSNSPPSEQR